MMEQSLALLITGTPPTEGQEPIQASKTSTQQVQNHKVTRISLGLLVTQYLRLFLATGTRKHKGDW